MRNLRNILVLFCAFSSLSGVCGEDWAQFHKYEKQNSDQITQPNIIFIGNSITEGWVKEDPDFFVDNNYIGRGISGQTSYQMLLRFRDDVLNLDPKAVVINCGTNDIAENNHHYSKERTMGNIKSMVELAEINNIEVILSSVLPSSGFYWRDTIKNVSEKIKLLNLEIEDYARSKGLKYINYYPDLVFEKGGLNPQYSEDGVHPNLSGYKIMEKIAMSVIGVNNNQQPIEIRLWEDKSPVYNNGLPDDAEVIENPGWISMVTDPVLYVYPANNPNGEAVLLCPGGGYYGVAIEHEGKAWAKMLNENGITLAVLKYRMPNGNYNVPYEDAMRSLEILHEKANEWKIDSRKIGIAGASAGGHLASTIATHSIGSDLAPDFQILLYPVITMDKTFTHQGSREGLLGNSPSEELINNYSNELQVTGATPKAFIAVSGNDNVVPVKNSIEYFQALNKNKVPASLFIYPTGGHGWGYNPSFIHNEEWTSELIHWLKGLYNN